MKFIFLYELIILINSHWCTGKYVSNYEYPELQLVFNCKEEGKGKKGTITENEKKLTNKHDFPQSSGHESLKSFRKTSEPKAAWVENQKPWMRGSYAEENMQPIKVGDKKSPDNQEKFNSEKWNLFEESDVVRNIPNGKIAMNEESEKEFKNGEKSMIYGEEVRTYNGKRNSIKSQNRRHRIIKKVMRRHNKQKVEDGDKIIPIKANDKKYIKTKIADSESVHDSNSFNHLRRNQYHEKRFDKFKREKKFKNNINRGLRKFSEYDENAEEYEELTNNINAGAFVNQHSPTGGINSQPGEESAFSGTQNIVPKKEVLQSNSKMEDVNTAKLKKIKNPFANNIPSKLEPFIKPVSKSSLIISLSQKDDSKSKGFPDHSYTTPSFLLPDPEKTDVFSLNNDVLAKSAYRSSPSQEKKQLFAKPPLKIANRLIEKHPEEEIDAGVEGHVTKVADLSHVNSVTRASTAFEPFPAVPKNYLSNNNRQENLESSNQAHFSNGALSKTKRNVNENNVVDPEGDEPQYYSMSQSNSISAQINSLMTKFKPKSIFKKNEVYTENVNNSVKRSVPQMDDLEYRDVYGFHQNRSGKDGVPLLSSHYDSDKDFDNGKESSLGKRHYNTTLTSEKKTWRLRDHYPRNGMKYTKKNLERVDDSYRDIFAHPLSLDDPELQIVRGDNAEFVNRHPHQKNYATRRHRMKGQGRKSDKYSRFHQEGDADSAERNADSTERYDSAERNADSAERDADSVERDADSVERNADSAERDAPARSPLRKKKSEYKVHSYYNKMERAKKQEASNINKGDISDGEGND